MHQTLIRNEIEGKTTAKNFLFNFCVCIVIEIGN